MKYKREISIGLETLIDVFNREIPALLRPHYPPPSDPFSLSPNIFWLCGASLETKSREYVCFDECDDLIRLGRRA